jgi:hypothetical protein
MSRGVATLEVLFKEEPATYAKLVVSLLPKDIQLETAVSDVSDDQLETAMEKIKEHLIAVRKEEDDDDSTPSGA